MKIRFALGLTPALAVVVAFAGCNGETLDLGESQQDGGTASRSSSPMPLDATAPHDAEALPSSAEDASSVTAVSTNDSPDSAAAPGDDASYAFLGDDGPWEVQGDDEVWSGYLENATWPTGSDAIRLTFSQQGDGGVAGHAYFGTLSLFPAPTDASVGYPYPDDSHNVVQDVEMVEGFAYTLESASLVGGRFRATVYPREMQAVWCSLQSPFLIPSEPDEIPLYSCDAHENSVNQVDAGCLVGGDPVNCAIYHLCDGRGCTCNATRCGVVAPLPQFAMYFDIAIEGAYADGSLLWDSPSATQLHLNQE